MGVECQVQIVEWFVFICNWFDNLLVKIVVCFFIVECQLVVYFDVFVRMCDKIVLFVIYICVEDMVFIC